MMIPKGWPSINGPWVYQAKGHIGMGYNVVTSIYNWPEVLYYGIEVKNKVKEKAMVGKFNQSAIIGTHWAPTANVQNFTTSSQKSTSMALVAFISMTGVDTGISRVIVPSDPSNPTYHELQKFDKQTLENLLCFLYHWWSNATGYHKQLSMIHC